MPPSLRPRQHSCQTSLPPRSSALPWDLLLSLLSTSEQDGGGTRKGKLGTLGTPRARSQPCQQPLLWPWPCLHSPGEQLELAGKLFCLYSTEHVLLHPRWGASRLTYPHSEGIMLFNPSPTRKSLIPTSAWKNIP